MDKKMTTVTAIVIPMRSRNLTMMITKRVMPRLLGRKTKKMVRRKWTP
jgi:hypothetical protein